MALEGICQTHAKCSPVFFCIAHCELSANLIKVLLPLVNTLQAFASATVTDEKKLISRKQLPGRQLRGGTRPKRRHKLNGGGAHEPLFLSFHSNLIALFGYGSWSLVLIKQIVITAHAKRARAISEIVRERLRLRLGERTHSVPRGALVNELIMKIGLVCRQIYSQIINNLISNKLCFGCNYKYNAE